MNINEILLNGGNLVIPFDVIAGGRQVSSIITTKDRWTAFNFMESPKDVGPIGFVRSEVDGDQLRGWLDQKGRQYAEISPREVRITEWSFWHDDVVEKVIYEIMLLDANGRVLRLCREGAAYPYGLLLVEGSQVEKAAA